MILFKKIKNHLIFFSFSPMATYYLYTGSMSPRLKNTGIDRQVENMFFTLGIVILLIVELNL